MRGLRKPERKRLRAAIIGAGKIAGLYDRSEGGRAAHTHAKVYAQNTRTCLTAVCDTDLERAKAFIVKWRVPRVYAQARCMLEAEKPECVSICAPESSHADLLDLCLMTPSVRAVWCEKPMGTDPERAGKIERAYRARGIILAVNYLRRWDAGMNRIGRMLKRGDAGKILRVAVIYSGGIYRSGSHAIDLLMHWFGDKFSLQASDVRRVRGGKQDAVVDAQFEIGGVPVSLVSLRQPDYGLFEIQIYGSSGRLSIKDFGRTVEWQLKKRVVGPHAGELREPLIRKNPDWEFAMPAALNGIITALGGGPEPLSNGGTALRTLEICRMLAQDANGSLRSRQGAPERQIC